MTKTGSSVRFEKYVAIGLRVDILKITRWLVHFVTKRDISRIIDHISSPPSRHTCSGSLFL